MNRLKLLKQFLDDHLIVEYSFDFHQYERDGDLIYSLCIRADKLVIESLEDDDD
jgi:hypothetical protein